MPADFGKPSAHLLFNSHYSTGHVGVSPETGPQPGSSSGAPLPVGKVICVKNQQALFRRFAVLDTPARVARPLRSRGRFGICQRCAKGSFSGSVAGVCRSVRRLSFPVFPIVSLALRHEVNIEGWMPGFQQQFYAKVRLAQRSVSKLSRRFDSLRTFLLQREGDEIVRTFAVTADGGWLILHARRSIINKVTV